MQGDFLYPTAVSCRMIDTEMISDAHLNENVLI